MVGGGAGMSRSPAEISFLEFTICTVIVGIHQRLPGTIDVPDARVGATETADVGHIARAYVDPIFLGSDNAWGLIEATFLDDQGLRQERLDRLRRNGGYRLRRQGLGIDARLKFPPSHTGGPGASAVGTAGVADAQLRRRYAPVEHEDIARGDVVRVSDLLLVHAPDFRPAPLIAEEFGGDAPEGIAPLDDVAVRRRFLYLQVAL